MQFGAGAYGVVDAALIVSVTEPFASSNAALLPRLWQIEHSRVPAWPALIDRERLLGGLGVSFGMPLRSDVSRITRTSCGRRKAALPCGNLVREIGERIGRGRRLLR
jgi:hypothetical protein